MSFDFASLTFRPAAVVPVVNDAELQLSSEAVVELWQERSAVQETDNIDLIRWYRGNGKSDIELRRACEVCAAADMSLQHGHYVESIIRPHIMNERD